jgi:hypothetical protein
MVADENADQVGTEGIIELLRALPIDVEQRIAAEHSASLMGLSCRRGGRT